MSDTKESKEEGGEPPSKRAKSEEDEEEAADEWTVLADSYVKVLVPSFDPIYKAVAEVLDGATDPPRCLMDYGCGPGEPALTLLKGISGMKKVLGVDSTKPMLEIAKKRAEEASAQDRIVFHHVRRDISMVDFKAQIAGLTTTTSLDLVVSAFVMHYVDFPRRVELVTAFLEMAPHLLLVTWGQQSKVGFLRAIKTFGKWKGSADSTKDICELGIIDEDDGNPQSPRGSFTMSRKENFQCIVDKVENVAVQLSSFETRTIPIRFPSVATLLNFLPMATDKSDCQAVWKLLQSWGKEHVEVGDGPDDELVFPSEVVFCRISRKAEP
ncbi:expressed unknown protein [Seminavis robusta]|uniref:Methyltransferase domain-containing protein n=1 Tax=Seminavis robusta TaxID=568900 RepID=A0A9N8ES97_9STRA|nr:expressed unknown protein [Seminavis robusta]|eukprot:Sro1538_g280810.1 n/a (325) ;mRNA; r:26196-27170